MSPSIEHTDGSPLFVDDLDQPNQERVKALLEAAWNCKLMSFGKLAIVDYYALQHERICGIVEIKGARYASTEYGTALLSVRKYDALLRHQICFGVPGLFVADFTDGVWFIKAGDVDHSRMKLRRRKDRPNETAIEPLIHVPVAEMRIIKTGTQQ